MPRWAGILESWAPEVAETAPGESQILCFPFHLLVREDFLPQEADIFFRVEVQGPGGGAGTCNNVRQALGQKSKIFLLQLLVFQFP